LSEDLQFSRETKVTQARNFIKEEIVMYETTIQLNAINDVKDFVNTVMLFNYDVDLVSGRYAIDAKSIMGIFSLDLSKPIKLQAHTDDPDALVKAISKYIVK
jgi:phosphotransferase system HPr-like phosphotransfer protein